MIGIQTHIKNPHNTSSKCSPKIWTLIFPCSLIKEKPINQPLQLRNLGTRIWIIRLQWNLMIHATEMGLGFRDSMVKWVIEESHDQVEMDAGILFL
jgi:hypothetical protein